MSFQEKKLGHPMNQDKLFRETHIVKKKKETDQERWVEGRASTVHVSFHFSLSIFIYFYINFELLIQFTFSYRIASELKLRNSYAASHLMSRARHSNFRPRMLKDYGRGL